MSISKETKERINFLFNTNSEMIEKLYKCDAEAIREIGILSQKRINPNDVIATYESGDPNAMKSLYQHAKNLVELQELYKELCFEYYKKTKDIPEHIECSSSHRRKV